MTFCWSYSMPRYVQAAVSGISERTLTRWNGFLRDVASTWLLRNPIRLGGRGLVYMFLIEIK